MKIRYYLRWLKWFAKEFSYRFWTGSVKSTGPNMTETEHNKWFN